MFEQLVLQQFLKGGFHGVAALRSWPCGPAQGWAPRAECLKLRRVLLGMVEFVCHVSDTSRDRRTIN